MRIIKSNVPDIIGLSIDQQKVALADEIINGIFPLLSEERKNKIQKIKKLRQEILMKTNFIKEEKQNLNKLNSKLGQSNKVITLLDRLNKLHSIGKLSGKKIIVDVINVVKNIERIKQDKLDHYLAETVRILTSKTK